MTREIRIFWNAVSGTEQPVAAASGDQAERAEVVACVRQALSRLPDACLELAPAELGPELAAAPLFSAVLRGGPRRSQALELEILNAIARLDAPLDLDVTFVPES